MSNMFKSFGYWPAYLVFCSVLIGIICFYLRNEDNKIKNRKKEFIYGCMQTGLSYQECKVNYILLEVQARNEQEEKAMNEYMENK